MIRGGFLSVLNILEIFCFLAILYVIKYLHYKYYKLCKARIAALPESYINGLSVALWKLHASSHKANHRGVFHRNFVYRNYLTL